MFGRRAKASSNTAAFAVGALATLLTLLLYLSGKLDRLEFDTLDYRFASDWLNPIPASDEIVSIDIDDRSLDIVGRWPWPRDITAALISIPAECGAKALLVDLDWNEHQAERLAVPDDADFADIAQPRLHAENVELIWPDRELRAAIFEAGNVYPAIHNFREGHIERSPHFTRAYRALADGNEAEARRRLLSAVSGSRDAAALASLWERVRVAAALDRNPTSDAARVASDAQLDANVVDRVFSRVRDSVLRARFDKWLDEQKTHPAAAEPAELRDAFFEALTGTSFGASARSEIQEAVQLAVREVLSLRATVRPALLTGNAVDLFARDVQATAPVHFLIAQYAVRPGFVNFEADAALDGVMRRETLIERCGDAITTQLAFGVGCAALGVTNDHIAAETGLLVVRPPGRRPLRFYLDQHQQILVPWTTMARMNRNERQFIPATRLWQLWDRRGQVRHNDDERRYTIRDLLVQPAFGERQQDAALAEAIDLLHRREHQARLQLKTKTVAALREDLASYEAQLNSAWQRARARWEEQITESAPTDTARNVEIGDAIAYIDRCAAANERLKAEIDEVLADLRQAMNGKICLLGYTATALADMKPTPISRSLPGVRAHLHLINGMLTGHTVRWLPTGGNVALITAVGTVAAAGAAFTRRRAMLISILLTALVLAAAAIAFRQATYWIAVVAPLLSIWLGYLSVVLYQFGFVDRERRALTKTLGQYTSAKLARQMAEQPELCRRAETREVSAMFTDMAGFTTISQNIGAERTQRLLNLSLGALADVMLTHDAMINKFIGDGVFAFWNPVIHPQADHARRACLTAVELFTALDALRAAQQRAGGDPAFADLHLRVGVASGNAVVGPCGSEQKYDYTCIGDTVNLAARLESANKFFGTRILVAEKTRELAGEGFAYRPLGSVQVKGRTTGAAVFELLGFAASVDAASLAYAEAFGRAVEAFQRRDWDAAISLLDQSARLRPADPAIERYREAIASAQSNPPGPDWSGAIELTEK